MNVNKKTIRTILIILITLAIISAVIMGLFYNKKWKTYKNTKYNFTLQYPAKWPVYATSTDNTGQIFNDPSKKMSCRAYGFENSIKNKDGKTQSLDELITWLSENLANDKVVSKKDTNMGGQKAKELVMKKGNSYSQGVYILGQKTGRGFICSYADLVTKNSFQSTFQHIQNSFKLTAPLDPKMPAKASNTATK